MRVWLGVVVLVGAAGCRAASTSPYAAQEALGRNTVRAQELSREAADLVHDQPEHAEDLLRQALVADLFYGPAHNNLGVVYLERGDLYAAANEFEWARKLMPGHPDPRTNLALTLERAGQEDWALAEYDAALEVYAGYMPALQGRTALALRRGAKEEEVAEALQEIVLRGTDEAWRRWAQRMMMPVER